MERHTATAANGGPAGPPFVIIGVGNTQADWARVLGALTNADPAGGTRSTPGAAAPGPTRDGPASEPDPRPAAGDPGHRGGSAAVPEPKSATPPSVLDLNAYLVYAIGKTARRRLTAKLTEHGLRLWHLTVLALLSDLGPQSKGTLATRLDMNASDLVKIVNDLSRAGHVDCTRDTEDRRRVVVGLTEEGRTALSRLNADIASADEEFLEPLSASERAQLGALLRRVHRHFDTTASHTVHEEAGGPAGPPAGPHPAGVRPVEALRIDWNRSAEEIGDLVRSRSRSSTAAYTHHGGRRLEILSAAVTPDRYDGAPGRVVRSTSDGPVIVAGSDGGSAPGRGLAVRRVRTEDGTEMSASEYFDPMPGGLTTES
ncbi:MarR family transcriptional regulator [Streptomyces sp. NPDC102278]|uniref:MarR family transcriptional regulator n=1 Tax=Streptomyces sp. NPDC102278 TaxID=3366152 RepID=UPI003823CE40